MTTPPVSSRVQRGESAIVVKMPDNSRIVEFVYITPSSDRL